MQRKAYPVAAYPVTILTTQSILLPTQMGEGTACTILKMERGRGSSMGLEAAFERGAQGLTGDD